MDKFQGRKQELGPEWEGMHQASSEAPIILSRAEIPVVSTHKFLSNLVDQELRWRSSQLCHCRKE